MFQTHNDSNDAKVWTILDHHASTWTTIKAVNQQPADMKGVGRSTCEHACVLRARAHRRKRAYLPQQPRSRLLVEIDQLGHLPASPATIR